MCMKYVNATIRTYYNVLETKSGIITFVQPFDQTELIMDREKMRMSPAFKAVIYINIMGSFDDENMESPVVAEDRLVFRLNLTQHNNDIANRKSKVLDLFEIDLADKKYQSKGCFDFLNMTRVIDVPALTLPEGKSVEVFRNETNVILQSMSELNFTRPR